MAKKKEDAAPKTALKVSGVGDLPGPFSVARFHVHCDPLGTEAEWVQLGRPLWTIRYVLGNGASGPAYAYARTDTPACLPLDACLTCPANCIRLEAGIRQGNTAVLVHLTFALLNSEEEGVRLRRRSGGVVGRWYQWDYGGDMSTHQRYQNPTTGEPELVPQFVEGDEPPPKAKRTRKKATPAAPAPPPADRPDQLDTPGLDPEPTATAAPDDQPQPDQENPPCPSTQSAEPSPEGQSEPSSKPNTEPPPSER